MLNDTTKLTVIGIDIAKNVFQVHGVNPEDSKIQRLKLSRPKFLLHFGNLAPCLVATEACSGAHRWTRELTKLGHQVKLLATKMVKPLLSLEIRMMLGPSGVFWSSKNTSLPITINSLKKSP